MVTQLQDVANTVAQEKISNQRLRNEEIRRQMANPWSEPTQPTTSGTQPRQSVTNRTLAVVAGGGIDNGNVYGSTLLNDAGGDFAYVVPTILVRPVQISGVWYYHLIFTAFCSLSATSV